MDIILLLVAVLGLWGARPRREGDHLSKDQTGAVNGLFVLLVFLRHAVDYIPMGDWDRIFRWVDVRLDQLIVAPFLFYSGYGIARSILAKGRDYVARLPWQRMFRVWYHFALAVGLYWLLSLWLGKGYDARRVLLSFTGWDSIGNSNWYIFATLYMYLATWLSFTVFPRKRHWAAALLTALAVVYILVLRQTKGLWWYDTALVYPAGIWYGLYRERLEAGLKKHAALPWLALAVCAGAFALSFRLQSGLYWRELMAVAFALLVMYATMVVQVGNRALSFLGGYTFEIYILQRLPMIALEGKLGDKYLYLALSFLLTLLLAMGARRGLERLDKWLYRPRS